MERFTQLLEAARAGDEKANDAIFQATYRELRELAHSRLRRAGKITVLDTTALVHECYLRLSGAGLLEIRDRPHFMCYAARAMRSVAVDFARRRLAQRRGGDVAQVSLDTGVQPAAPLGEEEVVRLSEALEELAQLHPRLVEIVELKYFCGLSWDEIATSLGSAERTVRRDWEKARALLFAAMQG